VRFLYLAGYAYVALAALFWLGGQRVDDAQLHFHPQTANSGSGSLPAEIAWFRAMRPYCNPVEVETRHRWTPAPQSHEGAAYSAACYALAGKIDRARALIDDLPADERWRAAGVVFNAGHSVADAGDDEAAGPIMELVVEYWPNHYMALYHAGMSRYLLGDGAAARQHLESFLRHYQQDDGWTRNARVVLDRLELE